MANGGAPAVVIVGIGLLAVSPALGIALIVLGSVWFIVRLDPVRKRLIALLGGDSEVPSNAMDMSRVAIAHAGEVHVHAQGPQDDLAQQTTRRRREIRLSDMVNEHAFVISNKTYEDVDFLGPAIIALKGTLIDEPHLRGDLDAIFWRVPDEKKEIIGAIAFENCVLRRCRFFSVGFAIPESKWAEIQANTTIHDGPMPAR